MLKIPIILQSLMVYSLLIWTPLVVRAQLVVTDPAALSKLVENINQGRQVLQNIEQQTEKMDKMGKSMEGNSLQGVTLKSALNRYKSIFDQVQRSIPNIVPENLPSGRRPDMGQPGDVKEVLDHIYNPAQPRNRNMQDLHRQTTSRAALESSELSIANADKRFAELSQLTTDIDGTQSLKEAADMTNKLLLKILMSIEELKNLQAELTRMEAAKNYTGLPANTEFRPQELSEGERLRRAATTGIPEFRARGCHPQMKEAGLCN